MGIRYIWYRNLYFGEKAAAHKRRLVKKIEKGRFMPDVFLLTLPVSRDKNILDIYRAIEFKQKIYDGETKYVIGVAKGKDEALDIVKELIDAMYKSQGDFDIRRFLDFDEQEV